MTTRLDMADGRGKDRSVATRRRGWLIGIALVVGLSLGGALYFVVHGDVEERATFLPPKEWKAPAHNRWLEVVATNATEPRPLVLAWEKHTRLPTFALYDDGRWLWHPLTEDGSLRAGRVTVDDARELHARVLDARLETIPPWQTRTPGAVDQIATTICVARTDRRAWVCASLEGWSPRDHVVELLVPTADGGFRVVPGRLGSSDARGPIPSPLARAGALLASFDASAGAPWSPSAFEVDVERFDRTALSSGPPAPSAEEWPRDLPPLPRPRAGELATVRLDPDDAARLEGLMSSQPGLVPFRAGEHEVLVGGPEPRAPAHDDVLAVHRSFLRLVGRGGE